MSKFNITINFEYIRQLIIPNEFIKQLPTDTTTDVTDKTTLIMSIFTSIAAVQTVLVLVLVVLVVFYMYHRKTVPTQCDLQDKAEGAAQMYEEIGIRNAFELKNNVAYATPN